MCPRRRQAQPTSHKMVFRRLIDRVHDQFELQRPHRILVIHRVLQDHHELVAVDENDALLIVTGREIDAQLKSAELQGRPVHSNGTSPGPNGSGNDLSPKCPIAAPDAAGDALDVEDSKSRQCGRGEGPPGQTACRPKRRWQAHTTKTKKTNKTAGGLHMHSFTVTLLHICI